MKAKLEKEKASFKILKEKYPQLLHSLDHWGTGPGWHPLLKDLIDAIGYSLQTVPMEVRGGMYVVQIKEKFGTLRFYMAQSTGEIDGAIMLAETISARTCEECGKPGALRNGPWLKTLCNQHELQRKKK